MFSASFEYILKAGILSVGRKLEWYKSGENVIFFVSCRILTIRRFTAVAILFEDLHLSSIEMSIFRYK